MTKTEAPEKTFTLSQVKSIGRLWFICGFLAGLGVMLIATTLLAPPRVKMTWPEEPQAPQYNVEQTEPEQELIL